MAQLPRLRDECVGAFDPVRVAARGVVSPRGKPGVRITMQGAIRVRCQRCMKPLALDLDIAAAFEWVSTEAELAACDDDDEWDAVLVTEQCDLLPLLEDELLLAVPYAPLHDACKPVGASEAGEKFSPFAALAAIKGKK